MFISFLHSAINFSTVFLFGSTGETLTEKSGHLNLGIPGTMCVGALGGVLGEYLYIKTLSSADEMTYMCVVIPIIFALIFAGIMGLIYSFMTVTLRCNQNVTGLTITTFGVGLANFVGSSIDNTYFSIASNKFFNKGFVAPSSEMNWFEELFLSYGTLVYLAFAIAIIFAVLLRKTRIGLNLRAVGENPGTADAAGINVTAYKYIFTTIGSAIAGLGGLFYIMNYIGGSWQYAIDAFGWLAVALVIFSIWKPDIGILGAILFGALYIMPNYINVGTKSYYKEIIKMAPFVVTIIVLIITSMTNKRETQPPAALGLSYFREER